MITFRNGAQLIICDGCYRPKKMNDPPWSSTPAGLPASKIHIEERGKVREGTAPAQDAHWCPDCTPKPPTPKARQLQKEQ